MKKSVLALILFAVLIIIVSPGIVGKLAENSVGENLNWAAQESGELLVTSDGFDRGWFSSEGQHRIELGEGQLRAAMGTDAGDLPALLINTHMDHGIIPVSSMSREEGSLAPGLASAVSTLAVDLGNGETIDLPGTIFSKVGLSGELDSHYIVEAGARTVEDGEVTWQNTAIKLKSSASSGDVGFDGNIGALTFASSQQIVSIDGLTFAGEQTKTPYGFHVGNVEMTMGEMSITTAGINAGSMQGMNMNASSSVDDGLVASSGRVELSATTIPAFGDVSVIMDMSVNDMDAVALGAVTEQLDGLGGSQDPTQILLGAEQELKALFASGFGMQVDQLDIGLPMGTVETKMSFEFPASDAASFEWTSLLLDAVASLDLKVPEALVQLATSMNPQAGALVGLGYLKKEGDFYIMDADFKKGLLTVNGAPIPIPMGAF